MYLLLKFIHPQIIPRELIGNMTKQYNERALKVAKLFCTVCLVHATIMYVGHRQVCF